MATMNGLLASFVFYIAIHVSEAQEDIGLKQKEDALLNFYSFHVKDIHGNDVSLNKYKGKVSLVVNVASQCGFTHVHYTQLVKLQRLFQDSGLFNVLAFPCNQFGAQEPGTNSEVWDFASTKYNVNFPMFSKVDVRGTDVVDIWSFLNEQSGQVPSWNFWKYLIGPDGGVVQWWSHASDVEDVTPVVQSTLLELKSQRTKLPPKTPPTGHDDL